MNLNLSVSQWQEGLTKFFSKGYQVTPLWGSRVLEVVQPAVRPLADQMQKNHYVAIAVFAIANLVFISVLSLLFNRKSDNEAEAGNSFNKVIKHVFVELVLVGGSIVAYNAILSKVTNYRLSHVALAMITASALMFRIGCKIVCNRFDQAKENETKPKEETKENKSEAVKETLKEIQATQKTQEKTEGTQNTSIITGGSPEQAQPVNTVKDEAGGGDETTVTAAGFDNVNSSKSGGEAEALAKKEQAEALAKKEQAEALAKKEQAEALAKKEQAEALAKKEQEEAAKMLFDFVNKNFCETGSKKLVKSFGRLPDDIKLKQLESFSQNMIERYNASENNKPIDQSMRASVVKSFVELIIAEGKSNEFFDKMSSDIMKINP